MGSSETTATLRQNASVTSRSLWNCQRTSSRCWNSSCLWNTVSQACAQGWASYLSRLRGSRTAEALCVETRERRGLSTPKAQAANMPRKEPVNARISQKSQSSEQEGGMSKASFQWRDQVFRAETAPSKIGRHSHTFILANAGALSSSVGGFVPVLLCDRDSNVAYSVSQEKPAVAKSRLFFCSGEPSSNSTMAISRRLT